MVWGEVQIVINHECLFSFVKLVELCSQDLIDIGLHVSHKCFSLAKCSRAVALGHSAAECFLEVRAWHPLEEKRVLEKPL